MLALRVTVPGPAGVGLLELVEAAVRAGHPDVAARVLEQFSSRPRTCNPPWALGLATRSRALTSTGPVAEEHHHEAIELLRDSGADIRGFYRRDGAATGASLMARNPPSG
ncbi:hypothetical protein [Actinotalea sp. K2]|uniref:hypothetical protein n=1 Tax=Actinotalea sp. K2 TaxID=2939438 RepID=UPI002016DAA7|nr:hypothetical protein [Actinotalea sp. K2]MCL3859837.1 hypothetical protein [Actinotalea sp. K2]